jgi:hypothetical protein
MKPAGTPERTAGEGVEVLDAANKPLCILPLGEVKKQSLMHRLVYVLVYDGSGRVLLHWRASGRAPFSGRWDFLLSSHVRAGDSRADTALRKLRKATGIRGNRLSLKNEIEACADNGERFISLYAAVCSEDDPAMTWLLRSGEGMLVDREELASLVQNCRETLTPELVYLFESGLVF